MQAVWLAWHFVQVLQVWSLPRPFRLFEGGEVEGLHPPNIRHFRHREDHSFEDGSEFSLHWDVDTDPDSLLELDLEHTRGVKILECASDRLVLQVSKDVLARLKKLEHVTASHGLHGCQHLQNEHLYHRVLDVRKVDTNSTAAIVEFRTKELETAQEVFRSCRFYLHVMPSGIKSEPATRPSSLRGERRLQKNFLDFLKDGVNSIGDVHGGNLNMQTGFEPDQANEQQGNSFFNLNNPREKDNFAWNWKYQANSSENPQYRYTFPGGTTWLRFYHPYVDAILGFTMNLSSHMPDITQAPHVMVDVVIRSYADMDLDVGAAADFDKDESSSIMENVLDTVPIPFFSKLKDDAQVFMRPLTFHLGGTPMTITPGMSVNMKIFHIGQMKGTSRVGLKTIVNCTGSMHFDTTFGEQHNISTEMLNVSFTSPTWLLFTRTFQLGVELAPNFWIKGGLGMLRDVEMGMGLRPYFNVSIQEQSFGSETKELAIYPYRVIGLPYGRRFAVRISANGEYKQTAVQMSTGVVEFQNKVQNFEFPPLTHHQLLAEKIQVDIVENGEDVVATGYVVCKEVDAKGRCSPHPTEVKLSLDKEDVLVHLGIFFQVNALGELEANMQSVSLRFPMVTFNPTAGESFHTYLKEHTDCIQLLLYHSGHTYGAPMKPKFPGGETSLWKADTIWELGPSFTEMWMTPPVTSDDVSTNRKRLENLVQIVCGEKILAFGQMLSTKIDQDTVAHNVEDLDADQKDSMNTIPAQVMLFSQDNPAQMVGSCQVELDIMPCEYGAFWVQPFEADDFVAGETYSFAWSTHGAEPKQFYKFVIEIVQVDHNGQMAGKFMHESIEVECSHDSRVKVHRYYGGNLPCIFEKQFTIPADAAGQTVLALASWSDAMDYPHLMASPSFSVKSSSRRLFPQHFNASNISKHVLKNDKSVHMGFSSMGHKEGLSPEATAAFTELSKHCNAQPLKYNFGMGLNYQQLLKNVPMGAGGMGAMGGAGGLGGYFTPDGSYITRPHPIWVLGQHNGEKLSDLLPKSVCAGGICSGMMLGCQKTKVTPIDIPKIAYKFSRTFNWIPHVGPSARHIIAYGLMVLPAAVKEAGREAKQIEQQMKENNETTPFSSLESMTQANFGNMFNQTSSRRLNHMAFRTKAGGEFKLETLEDMKDDWSHHGSFDEMVVQITHPMHYHLTDVVMKYLLSIDAFRGLEDGREATHGPIKIIGYELLDSPRQAAKKAVMRSARSARSRSPKPVSKVTMQKMQIPETSLWDTSFRDTYSRSFAFSCLFGSAVVIVLAALLSLHRRSGYDSLPASSSGE